MGSLPELRHVQDIPGPYHHVAPRRSFGHEDMGGLPELGHIHDIPGPHHHMTSRRSFGAATGLQVRPLKGATVPRPVTPKPSAQPLAPALLEIHGGRRRESCASSVGATSVRRLVRGGGGAGGGPPQEGHWPMSAPWTRRATAAILARFFTASSLLALQALQGSFGPWHSGPLLLSLLHGVAALAALPAPAIIRALRPHRLLTASYLLLAAFFALHLYPKVYILIPAYILAGLCWTPMALAHDTILGDLAILEGYQDTPNNHSHAVHPAGGGRVRARTLLRRLTRASRFARDCGLIMAAVSLPFLPSTPSFTLPLQQNTSCVQPGFCNGDYINNKTSLDLLDTFYSVNDNLLKNRSGPVTEDPKWLQQESDEELEEWREKSCGYRGCPGHYTPTQYVSPGEGMSGVAYIPYVLCSWCLLGAVASLWCWGQDSGCPSSSRVHWHLAMIAARDTKMKFIAPLAFFIGLEQGFFYAQFLQWYVVCVFGSGAVWHVLGGAAFLRALVAATLSMLLAHGRRRLVAGVGLVWHACLLLALGSWRAADTDRSLPPGMAAAWAGCGAVWDLLLPTIVDERIPGGRTALALSLRSAGLSIAMCARALLCARWALRALFLALPAATAPLLFIPHAPHR